MIATIVIFVVIVNRVKIVFDVFDSEIKNTIF